MEKPDHEVLTSTEALEMLCKHFLKRIENLIDYEDLSNYQSWAFSFEEWEDSRSKIIEILSRAGYDGLDFTLNHKVAIHLENEDLYPCKFCKSPHDETEHCFDCNHCSDHCQCNDESIDSNESPTEEIPRQDLCPKCDSESMTYLGHALNTEWYRCRQCGTNIDHKELQGQKS